MDAARACQRIGCEKPEEGHRNKSPPQRDPLHLTSSILSSAITSQGWGLIRARPCYPQTEVDDNEEAVPDHFGRDVRQLSHQLRCWSTPLLQRVDACGPLSCVMADYKMKGSHTYEQPSAGPPTLLLAESRSVPTGRCDCGNGQWRFSGQGHFWQSVGPVWTHQAGPL
jgi:hypothetical protein